MEKMYNNPENETRPKSKCNDPASSNNPIMNLMENLSQVTIHGINIKDIEPSPVSNEYNDSEEDGITEEDYARLGFTQFDNPFLNVDDKYEALQYYKTVKGRKKRTFKYDTDNECRIYQTSFKGLLSSIQKSRSDKNQKSIVNGVHAILLYIISNVTYISSENMDSKISEHLTVDLREGTLLDAIGLSRANAKNCLKFLREHNVIAKSGKYRWHYVNPKYIFPGNRMKYMELHTPYNILTKRWLEDKN